MIAFKTRVRLFLCFKDNTYYYSFLIHACISRAIPTYWKKTLYYVLRPKIAPLRSSLFPSSK